MVEYQLKSVPCHFLFHCQINTQSDLPHLQELSQGMFNAERYLQKAVFSYRKGGSAEKGEIAHRKLLDLQKQIPQFMIPITAKRDSFFHKIMPIAGNSPSRHHYPVSC